jgi:hypothetical protein
MMLIKGGDEQLMYKASELAGFQDGMVGDGVARSSAIYGSWKVDDKGISSGANGR